MFDESVKKSDIELFAKLLPIDFNKKLIKRDIVDLTELPAEVQEKITSLAFMPIDFLIISVVKDFPNNIVTLQNNTNMINFGKEIRKRNFSKKMIDKLDRLALYFAVFFYESRTHTIWRTVLDSLIKAPFTPEHLLTLLDTLYRRDAGEYLQFYSVLSQNSSLTRVIYLITSMSQNTPSEASTSDTAPSEEIMSISKLNQYAHHWFPGIVLAAVNHPGLYKTTLDKVYDELYAWSLLHQTMKEFYNYHLYEQQPETPQKINPQLLELLEVIVSHPKVSSKILHKESSNSNISIRKAIALSPNATIPILSQLQEDTDEYVRKIALSKLIVAKKEREYSKKSIDEDGQPKQEKKNIAPNNIQDQFTEKTDIFYF